MAASPLEQIDWDNLQAGEMTTAIGLLMRATQERYQVSQARANGTIFSGQGSRPSYFPVGDPIANTPHYGIGPLGCPNAYVKDLLFLASAGHTDKTRFESALGTDGTTYTSSQRADLYQMHRAADNPAVYRSRMHEVAGVTGLSDIPGPDYAFPDISSGAPEEVKKWYDLLVTLKYVYYSDANSDRNFGVMDDAPNDVRQRGEFDPTINGTLFIQGIDGGKMYGAEGLPQTTDETEYLLFKTGHDLLLGGGADDWFSRVDGPTESFEPTVTDRYELIFDGSPASPYIIRLKAYQLQYQLDWSGLHSVWNLTGVPRGPIRLQYQDISDNNVSSVSSPVQTETQDVVYSPTMTLTNTGADTQTIDIDDHIVKAAIPATSSGFGSGKFDYRLEIPRFTDVTILEWDYEGGYQYYTP